MVKGKLLVDKETPYSLALDFRSSTLDHPPCTTATPCNNWSARKALKFGDFTLASGKQAKYYLDCRQITLDAQGARLIGEGMLDLLADDMPELVGGMAIGADPITAAILTLAGVHGVAARGVMVRKEAKQHGTGKLVEGPFREGESIVIVEDVVTTGGSSLLAIERCEAVGLKVRACWRSLIASKAGAKRLLRVDMNSPHFLRYWIST